MNGTFNVLRISNYLQLGISRSYLASNKLTLQSIGPKTKISLDVTLKDNEMGLWEILIFVIHTVVAVSVSGGVVWALYLWQKRRPEPTEEEPDDFAANCANIRLNEDEKSGELLAQQRDRTNSQQRSTPEDEALDGTKQTELPQITSKLAESSIVGGFAAQKGNEEERSLSPVVSDDDEEVDSEEFERQQQQKKSKEEENSAIKMPESRTIDSDPED